MDSFSGEYVLLSNSLQVHNHTFQDTEVTNKTKTRIFLHTFRTIFKVFWPICLVVIFQFTMPFISIAFAGHLSTDALAATGLATSVINITAIGMGSGMTSAFDVLAPQALGAKKYHQVGILLQRLIMIVILMACLIIAVWVNIDGLLKLCNEPLNVGKQTRLYLLVFIPGLFALVIYRALRSYVLILGFTKMPILTCFICIVLHTLFNYVFIFPLNLGLVGAALATTLSMICMPLTLFLYIYLSKLYRTTWCGFTSQSFLEWSSFTRLALLGVLGFVVELLFNEITVFLMGIIGTKELAVQAVLFQIKLVSSLPSMAWGIASCYLIGQNLGAGNPQSALRVLKCGLVVNLLFGLFLCGIVVSLRHFLGRVFSSDISVQQLISDRVDLVGISIIFECIHFCNLGATLGAGKPKLNVAAVIFGSYLVGLPISVSLTFYKKMGLLGMWTGICSGVFAITLAEIVILFCLIDFSRESQNIREKAGIRSTGKHQYGSLDNTPPVEHNTYLGVDSKVNESLEVDYHGQKETDQSGGDEEVRRIGAECFIHDNDLNADELKVPPTIILVKGLFFLGAFVIIILAIIIRSVCYTV